MNTTEITGFPSIDKPWLKYYSQEAIESDIPKGSMYDFLYENNKDHLEAKAINYFGRKISYRTLFIEIEKVAKAFQAIGIKPGEAVSLVALSGMPAVTCLYGLNRIGAIFSFVNVLASEEDFVTYMKESSLKVVVTLDLFIGKVLPAAKKAGVKKIVCFSLSEFMPFALKIGYGIKNIKNDKTFLKDELVMTWKEFLSLGENSALRVQECPKDICYYGHTGGTTGFPKTVLLKNASFNVVAQNYMFCFEHKIEEPFLSTIIPFVTYGVVINIHMPLCAGFETVLLPKFDADAWPEYIQKYKIKHVCAIPSYVEPMLDKLEGMDLSELVTIGMGGEGMNIPLEEKMNAFLSSHGSVDHVIKGYGMTEVCATATTEYPFANRLGSVGIPLVKNNFMIYDNDTNTELKYGETGEVCMQCASEMAGYKDNPEETKNLIRTHADGSRWLHTGDLGHIDEDGFLFIEGRMKRMIITTYGGVGYKAFPELIEAELCQCEYVADVCVVSGTDGVDRVLHAYIITNTDCGKDEKEIEAILRQYAEDNMSMYTRPCFYSFIKEFPRTPAGKVDYRKLENS